MPCHKSQNPMKIYNFTRDYHGTHSHVCHNANCYICVKFECIINNTINFFFLKQCIWSQKVETNVDNGYFSLPQTYQPSKFQI